MVLAYSFGSCGRAATGKLPVGGRLPRVPRVLRDLSMRHQWLLRGWCLDIEWSGRRDQHSRLNPAGSKISDPVRYLATLLIAPASVIDLFFLQ